jgi:hypothetical protein
MPPELLMIKIRALFKQVDKMEDVTDGVKS